MRRIVAAAIVKNDRLLIAKRNYGSLSGFWEFPGGKSEDGETDVVCLEREIMEELMVKLKVEEFLGEQNFLSNGEEYVLALYRAVMLNDDFQLSVHSEIAWVKRKELHQFKLAPADRLLLEQGCLEGVL